MHLAEKRENVQKVECMFEACFAYYGLITQNMGWNKYKNNGYYLHGNEIIIRIRLGCKKCHKIISNDWSCQEMCSFSSLFLL